MSAAGSAVDVRPGTSSTSSALKASKAFRAVLGRDLYVTFRELPTFLAQVILQPLFLLFVFGRVLTDLGYARAGYAELLFPGILGLTAVVTGLQSTAFPLVIDFSYTKEIEDRLLAPLPVNMVAVAKMLYAALRAIVASTVMLPKLFRRLADYLALSAPETSLEAFRSYLETRDDRLFILGTGHWTGFDTVVSVHGQTVRLTENPEALIFDER